MNAEPTTEFLRLRDVLAWLPKVTAQELRSLETANVIHPFTKREGARRFYHKSEIKRAFRLGL